MEIEIGKRESVFTSLIFIIVLFFLTTRTLTPRDDGLAQSQNLGESIWASPAVLSSVAHEQGSP